MFTTNEVHEFYVALDEGEEWAIVLSPDPTTQQGIGFSYPADGAWAEVDMGWLATKFGRLGTFYWSACRAEHHGRYDWELIADTCSEPWSLRIRFELRTLTASQARSHARRVFKRLTPGSNRVTVACRRRHRTRQACDVSTFIGDSIIYGRIVLRNQRVKGRTWDETRYHARLRILNEYCRVVNKRPRSECDDPYKTRRGRV